MQNYFAYKGKPIYVVFIDLQKAFDSVADVAKAGDLIDAVSRAANGATSMAKQNRRALDGMMRQHMQKAQGMVNQLGQLLGMTRSG